MVAVMDWYSRYVVAWRLSNTLEAGFCIEALQEALDQGQPEVFNTDQGSQFTSLEFTQVLQEQGVKISIDGKNWYQGNIFVERIWQTVKYEDVHLKALRRRSRNPQGTGGLLPVLQPSEAPSGLGLPDAGRGVPRRARSWGRGT